MLPAEHIGEAAREACFVREAITQGSLSHTNIFGVHDAGRAGSAVYYAMELVVGPSLRPLPHASPPRLLRDRGDVRAAGLRIGGHDTQDVSASVRPR